MIIARNKLLEKALIVFPELIFFLTKSNVSKIKMSIFRYGFPQVILSTWQLMSSCWGIAYILFGLSFDSMINTTFDVGYSNNVSSQFDCLPSFTLTFQS